MRRDARVLFTYIEQAGADIETFTVGMDSDAFAADVRTKAAVEHKFEIIGEAVNRLHKDNPELALRIPEMRRIVDFRNFLAHGYDDVASRLVWRYASNNLPQLRDVVQALLAELQSPEK